MTPSIPRETADVGTTPRARLSRRDGLAVFEREHGRCALCGLPVRPGRFIFEHMRALELGGTNDLANIRLTCEGCAAEKTRDDHHRAAKAKRAKAAHLGIRKAKRPILGSKASGWRKTFNHGWEKRT